MKNYKNNYARFAVIAIAALCSNASKAITVYTSKGTGNWSTASNWTVSGSGTDKKYVIQSGHNVSLDVSVTGVDTLSIYGTLTMQSNRTITIDTLGTIIVQSGGKLTGGSSNSKLIFVGSSYQINGPFTSANNNEITNGPRYATAITTIAASGSAQGSFVSLVLLPVELASIEVVKVGADFQLQWTALGESNKSSFGVEISNDGKNFWFAGQIAGNNEINSGDYTFNIIGIKGNFYVRLIETDINGNSKALSTKYVKNNTTSVDAFKFYPTLITPAGENINMVLPTAGEYKVVVYNLNMQVAAESTASTYSANEAVAFNSSNWNLNAGQFIVVVQGNNGEVYKTRIMVK